MTKHFSRREFLQTSGTAAGALVAARTVLLDPEPMAASPKPAPPSDRVRFGIIGIGMQGSGLLGTAITLPGVECVAPEGAFYVFPRVAALYAGKKAKGSVEFCRLLLEEARVAAVPGEAFGMDSCVRLSFATPVERIQEGLRRLAEWIRRDS